MEVVLIVLGIRDYKCNLCDYKTHQNPSAVSQIFLVSFSFFATQQQQVKQVGLVPVLYRIGPDSTIDSKEFDKHCI